MRSQDFCLRGYSRRQRSGRVCKGLAAYLVLGRSGNGNATCVEQTDKTKEKIILGDFFNPLPDPDLSFT